MMKDYRPISCCNVLYNVISKLIANRLKSVLPKFITLNQSAFIKERLLIENVLLATELVKDYHSDSISLRCALQVDISKAFDSVQWTFLLNTLEALGLPGKFISWIARCIISASFSLQVNGELAGYFQSKRGLRQGCSLSPYHLKCKNIDLTHLCFADDLMIFADGTKHSIEGILRVFEKFDKMSGLKISMDKSVMFMAGDMRREEEMGRQFRSARGRLPVRYLGLPLLTKNMTVTDFLPLIEKVKEKDQFLDGEISLICGASTVNKHCHPKLDKLLDGCV